MTSISHNAQRKNLKQEVRQLKASARQVALSQESAKRFLVSTGVYTRGGKLAAKFR